MNDFWNKHNLFYRICASVLIILHLATFGPIRDALAFSSQSASYRIPSGTLNEGGKARSAPTVKLWQDVIGEPCIGKATSINYILIAGFIPTVQPNSPVLIQDISFQRWAINSSKENAFDLDDYFVSPEGYPLNFAVSGNSQINVNIDPSTHLVSFSQPEDWYGIEKVYFSATDIENAVTQSNKVVLQVENTLGSDKPAIVDVEITPSIIKEGDLVKLTVQAIDLDNENLTFSYGQFFTETARWKEGDVWFSEATWQTGSSSTGHYNIGVTVTDPTSLTDAENVLVNVGNFNHPPVLEHIADITANEGDSVVITPQATDSDNDAITYYFASPFDTQGRWLTGYDGSGTYSIKVIASDGIDTVSQDVNIAINNVNRQPEVSLTLSSYTVRPDEVFTIFLSAVDLDGDTMTFSLKKDEVEIASGSINSTFQTTASFANLGDHTISVTVEDSAGKITNESRGVDVSDYDADSINPVMGDFNGDALTDLGLHNSDTGTWEICISAQGVFHNAVDWLTDFGTTRDWWPMAGDFNGDGKTDAAIYNYNTGELKVALSGGSGFTVSGTWLSFSSASSVWQPFTGNFNADKYTDFALYNKDTGEVKVALGTGSGFGALTTWISSFGNDYIALSGDFNGDSLTDLCLFRKSSGEFKVAFSNSKEFVDGASWLSGFATDKDTLVSDFNNDGLADVGYWDKSGYRWYYAISTGDRFIDKGVWLEGFGVSQDESATTGDFDGNGITDAACFDRDRIGIERWTTRLSTHNPADLLTEIDNGIGGKTQVTYTYAATSDNPALPFPVYVASSISLVNTFPSDRAATYIQNFTFSGGYYDAAEREFRGFAKVKVTDPITNNYSETYFYQGKFGQDGALKGQIEKIISYDGNAKKISETLNTYEVRKSGPESNVLGFPALIEQTSTVWEENDAYVTTKDKFSYDNIGNLLEEVDEGNTSKTGDEKSAVTTYAQAYETGFNRPLETLLKDKDGNTVSQKNFEYDAKGNLIKETSWLNTQEEQPFTQYSYDSFGNLVSTTNALGSVVTTNYETDFYTYPESVTNSFGHTVQYTYEPKFGVILSTTDANASTSSTSYDSLGRPLQVKNADSQVFATYNYPDFNTKISTNAIGLSRTEYIDGLGRKYKAVSSGEDGAASRNISSEVYYNNRGQVEQESLAHYIDEDPAQISYVRYEYDIRGRVKKTISDFPGTLKDAESSISYINPLYAESTDPMGHKKGALKGVYGNIIEVTEFTQGGVYTTSYEYDTQNNLIKTTDSQGNISQIFYDSLGRKTSMIDPDMGTWSYEYDLVGNLKKQTDAKGQVLEFTYDALNRLTAKRSTLSANPLVEYFYDDSAKDYCIGRLSKIIDQSGSTEFFYDKLGREIKSVKIVQGSEFMVQREYDILDRLTKLTYPDNSVVQYSYDSNSGLLEKVFDPLTSTYYILNTEYNALGQIKTIQYGNNAQTTYTYGQDLRLSRILTQGLSTLQDLNYIFDKNGNLATLTDNLRSNIRTFVYDNLDRLNEAHNLPAPGGGYADFYYQYDSIGNMVYKSDLGVMTYGQNAGPHALTSSGGYTYQYDANGNMVSGKNKTMAYDAENRLLEVNESGIITSFSYDGDGGRVRKTTASGTTTYIGSLFEIDSSGKTIKHIFAGSNRVATVESTGSTYYYHSDHLGSSNVITNQSGQQAQYCEYTPYGTLARNEGTDAVTHKFTGKELDSTGLYFYGARYYDPEIGRFITADTIVQAPYDPQSLNRYAYARNNPIKYIDPNGRWFWVALIVGAILGGASAAANDQPIWKGVLMGALGGVMVGAGAAGFGFWGAVAGGMFAGAANSAAFGGNIGFGALCGGIGAGLGYGLGSWASGWNSGSSWGELGAAAFAGSIAGGVGAELSGGEFGQGAWMGAAYGSAGFFGSKVGNSLDPRTRQAQARQREARARHALNSKKNDMIKIPVGSRDVSFFKLAGHEFLPNWEMGPGPGGKIYTTNTVKDLSGWATHIETQSGAARGYTTAEVSASGLVDAIEWYNQNWVNANTQYSPISFNSNYAVNTVIYAAGGSVPGGLGWTPPGGLVPSSVFYPYVHRED
jgi:RHS repeat-associated protein